MGLIMSEPLYVLNNGDKEFTLTGWDIYGLVSALQALMDGQELSVEELIYTQNAINYWEAVIGLERVMAR